MWNRKLEITKQQEKQFYDTFTPFMALMNKKQNFEFRQKVMAELKPHIFGDNGGGSKERMDVKDENNKENKAAPSQVSPQQQNRPMGDILKSRLDPNLPSTSESDCNTNLKTSEKAVTNSRKRKSKEADLPDLSWILQRQYQTNSPSKGIKEEQIKDEIDDADRPRLKPADNYEGEIYCLCEDDKF